MKRKFEGVWIPAALWECNELTIQEKVFLVEVNSLDNEQGCYASNKYFAEFFNLSQGRCSQIIQSLIEKGCLSVDYEKEGKQVTRRILKTKGGYLGLLERGIKYPKGGYLENDEENSTSTNSTIDNMSIPAYEEFFEYAMLKQPSVCTSHLRMKYDAWVENGWKDGNGKAIKNWKTKILNTLPHLKKVQTNRIAL